MAAPVIGQRTRFAPGPGASIDRTHPISANLEICVVPRIGLNDIASGYPSTRVGNVQVWASRFGQSAFLQNSRIDIANVPDSLFLGPVTILWAGTVIANTASGGCVYKSTAYNSITKVPFSLGMSNTGALLFRRSSDSDTTQAGAFNATFTAGYSGVVVTSAPADMSGTPTIPCWQNASYSPESVAGLTAAVSGSSASIIIGNASTSIQHAVAIVAIWSRQLSEAEARMLYADPFCFIRS